MHFIKLWEKTEALQQIFQNHSASDVTDMFKIMNRIRVKLDENDNNNAYNDLIAFFFDQTLNIM